MNPTYPRVVARAALQGLLTAAWIAARELPPGRRRLTRAGSMLALAAVGSIGKEEPAAERAEEQAEELAAEAGGTPAAAPEVGTRRLVVVAASVAVSVGVVVGRRQLEKRWLAALARDGHPHPHRALAIRMGLLSFVATLPRPLVKAYQGRRSG